MPNNPLTLAELSAYTSTFPYPQIPAGYFFASPVSGAGPLAYRLFDAKYITIGTIDPDRLGTGATGAGNLYLADDGTWKTISVGGGGDMLRATYDVDNDGVVDSAERTEIIVRNSTGATLTKGQIVYLSGATGNRPNAVLSKADTEATSSKTIGIVVANINNNSDGYVATNGTLHDLNTSAFADGTAVWLSATTAGGMTSTVPAEPNHAVFIGYIARSHPTAGRIVLHIQNGYELDELHGVLLNSPANNDLLVYESATALWKNKTFSSILGGTPLVSVPTLAQVTTAGNTTLNSIGLGLTTAPTYRLEVAGTTLVSSSVSVQGAFNVNPLAAPPAIGGFTLSAGTNLGVGQYYYFVTYVTAVGETSAGANLTVTTTTGNTTVNLTGIPISTDPRVIARKIYRTLLNQTSDAQRFLVTINDNTTTTYTDSATDASLTGVALQYYKVNTTARYFTVSGVQGMVIDQNLTALGRSAGNAIIASNGSAVRTVLIGADAGKNITTGQANVIVGVAGVGLTTGNDNSLVGDLSGYNINSGGSNSIFGAQSGRFLTGGARNLILGAFSGRTLADGSTQFTSGTNNTIVGGNIRMFTASDTNSIVIGYDARGLGSNTTVIGNSSTTFTSIPAGNVGVGTTTNAGFKLDVNGTTRVQGAISSTVLTTDGPVVSTAGVLGSVAGYTGMVTIQQPVPLPPVTFDIQNGIIVNVL